LLPTSLTELDCGWAYNQPFSKGILPQGLKILNCGLSFTYLLNDLPPFLISLTVGALYNYPLFLPSGLMKLKMPKNHDYRIAQPLLSEPLRGPSAPLEISYWD
jgi:hypothetical protein